MGCTKRTLLALLLLGVNAEANAAIDVLQVDEDLYVSGGRADDSLYVYQFVDYQLGLVVVVYDYETGNFGAYYGVESVWVDTAGGDDSVAVFDYAHDDSGASADVHVATGNGEDFVYVDQFLQAGAHVTVATGNGSDSVLADVYRSHGNGAYLGIDTGNGGDEVTVEGLDADVDVLLGNGDDSVLGYLRDSFGTVDGGRGEDDRSFFQADNGTVGDVAVLNCEID